MLKQFVKEAAKLYGNGFVLYIIHSLIHVVDDFKQQQYTEGSQAARRVSSRFTGPNSIGFSCTYRCKH